MAGIQHSLLSHLPGPHHIPSDSNTESAADLLPEECASVGVVSVIMLPLSQLQDIGEVALISIVGTVGMMTAVVIATLKLLMMDVKGAHHEAVHNDGFNVAIVALMDIVFTFGGKAESCLQGHHASPLTCTGCKTQVWFLPCACERL